MKNSIKILLGLFLVFSVASCNQEETAEILPVQQLQDVVFDINNFTTSVSGKNSLALKENADDEQVFPECSDSEASYVIVNIDGTDYTLQLVTLNDKTETEVIKLPEGDYNINSFIVYDANDVPIWASPMVGSYYQNLWQLNGVNQLPFSVEGFNKLKVEVDVLCYKPFDYERFGFAWFAYSRTEIHTVCFFGDICSKFYQEWHMANEQGNPYLDQDYDGYDFAAIFEIVVKDAEGNVVNDLELNSNVEWQGVGSPLCIEYPDQVGVDETFTFEIWLAMPNGGTELIHTGEFDDSAMAEIGNEEGFGGTDGVFDFVVGNCSYDGNDANLELPAYIPLPETLDITARQPSTLNTYLDLEISNVVGGPAFGELYDGAIIGAWCGDLFNNITLDQTYTADVYSSLDLSGMPTNYAAYGDAWNVLNWLINNHDLNALVVSGPYTADDIQEGIWNLIHNQSNDDNGFMAWAGIDLTSNLASVDPAILSFIPTVGDWAMVLLDPREAPEQEDLVQLMIVRVDP